MTKRERVIAAMNQENVDRPPVGFWFHFTDEQETGQACIVAHLDYYNNIDVDMAKLMCDGYFDYPNAVAKAVSEPDDWFKMEPLGPHSAFITEQVTRAKAVRAGLKDDMVALYNVFAPFSLIRFAASDEVVMSHLREKPEAIMYALSVIAKDVATLSEKLLTEGGMDGVYYCVQGGEIDRMTQEGYARFITPSDLMPLQHANGFSDMNVLHCCGWAGVKNRLENWRDYPSKCVNWACYIEDMDIATGRSFFGDRCVLGGFDNRKTGVLYSGTRDEIEAFTKSLISRAPKTGFIIGADCTLPSDIDKQRIRWVVEYLKNL